MIRDTHEAVKAALQGISDPRIGKSDVKAVMLRWAAPAEHVTPELTRTPVQSLVQTQLTISHISTMFDGIRAHRTARYRRKCIVDGKKMIKEFPWGEPKRLMYQIEVRTEGDSAYDRLVHVSNEVNIRLKTQSYIRVTTRIYDDAEQVIIPCLIQLQNETYAPPGEGSVDRRSFRKIFTYLIDSMVFDRRVVQEAPPATTFDPQYNVDSPIGK